jgi:predicted nucleic acid-binding protein
MRFWDSSALVPFLVHEPATDAVRTLRETDPLIAVAWTTLVECGSAVARAEHDGLLSVAQSTEAFARLDELAAHWREVETSNEVRDLARRFLRVHRLRSADAIQLAAATLAAERRPPSLPLVTLDERLEAVALKEGFPVIVPGRGPAADPDRAETEDAG